MKLTNKEIILKELKQEFGEDCIVKTSTVTEDNRDIEVIYITNLRIQEDKKDYLEYLDRINKFNLKLSLDFHIKNHVE